MKRRALLKGVAAGVAAALGINRDLGAHISLTEDPPPYPLKTTEDDRAALNDLIYDISPADTPFCNRFKRCQ